MYTPSAISLSGAAETTPPVKTADSTFTPAQQDAIGKIAADYLRSHPELLIEMSQKLQAQAQQKQATQSVQAALSQQAQLLGDPDSPVLNPQGDVAVVQFFDYQCVYCSRTAPAVEALIRANPGVRVVWKEWPIFGGKWPLSATAAQTGVGVWKLGGAEAYHRYHAALYATGHIEGELTAADIDAAVKQSGTTATAEGGSATAALDRNNALAKALGIQGTPAFVVMPVTGASADNVSVIPGAVSQAALQAAVDKARASAKQGG
ncbi:DSBA oxidoreductase [Erwinia typographi]|uniref:DSBA oxidoreductase n=1 Tax=Erwinia typographi TaxID=371042 RepID=A0A0A3ZAF4_9GAMM|nr:DSBA oxidoreductase [Erwinia typographi]